METELKLSDKTNLAEINRMATWVSGNQENRQMLWSWVQSANRRLSINALWTMTHLHNSETEWILSLRDEMIDMLLAETDSAKKRMLLQILRKQEYDADGIRTDFLDYCMSKINSEYEPYAIRCFCIYTAFKMCRHYPELVAELEDHLDMMLNQTLSPGLKSALRQTKAKIRNLNRHIINS